jgi:predicted Zn-dependent peptidase
MEYQSYQLSNGFRLIHKPDNSAVSYCGIVINTGSRDEYEHEHGMAHFIEHMFSKVLPNVVRHILSTASSMWVAN